MGAAAVIAAQLSHPNATPALVEEPSQPSLKDDAPAPTARERSISHGSEPIVDPEIVERIIKPAIDPQYGDLLPLPSQRPWNAKPGAGPGVPSLPDSRPDTPPEERERLRSRAQSQILARQPGALESPVQFSIAEPAARPRTISQGSQVVDPEIVVQRIIKPAIDPQYGDLLPLPPSEPGSPKEFDQSQELPALPDSRPETPPEERAKLRSRARAQTQTHIRRRSGF